MKFFLIAAAALIGGFGLGAFNKMPVLSRKIYSAETSLLSLDSSESRNSSKMRVPQKDKILDSHFRSDDLEIFPIKISDIVEPEIKAESAILMDMETNKIIFAKNSIRILPIASISKIFTALVACDSIKSDAIIKISRQAVSTEALAGDLKEGEEFKAGDLIDLMLISSSNDAAAQIAEHISGSKEEFAELMNKKAETMGLFRTSFSDPTGLSDKNVSTAFDIAKAVKETFPKSSIWNILKEKQTDIYSLSGAKHNLKNTNEMISKNYIIAGKTGFTSKAKGTFAAIADAGNNGKEIISVVLGSDDRFGDTKKLVDWARKNFKWQKNNK